MRQYGDTVRLVTTTGRPAAAASSQPDGGTVSSTRRAAQPRDRARAPNRGLAPGHVVTAADEVYHPRTSVGTRARWPCAPSDPVHAARRLGRGRHRRGQRGLLLGRPALRRVHRLGSRPILRWGPDTTRGRTARPAAGGRRPTSTRSPSTATAPATSPPGRSRTVKDRWSLDEHDGHLRVAVAWPPTGSDRAAGQRDRRARRARRPAGAGRRRSGLGIGEQIQSVRWFDDLAVLVTFRQMDPLYTST